MQIQVDLTIEKDGCVTVFEAKNTSTNDDRFNIYQLYYPFKYYYDKNQSLKHKISKIECCYVLYNKKKNDISLYLYTFDTHDDISSIRLLKSKKYRLIRNND